MARISKEQLEKLQKNYKTDEAIGPIPGISRQAVHWLRTRYGIAPVRDKHKVRDNEILRYYREGLSWYQAGAEVQNIHLSGLSDYQKAQRAKREGKIEKLYQRFSYFFFLYFWVYGFC